MNHFSFFGEVPELSMQSGKSYKALLWNINKSLLSKILDYGPIDWSSFALCIFQEAIWQSSLELTEIDFSWRGCLAKTFTLKKTYSTGLLTLAKFQESRAQVAHSKETEPFTKTPKASLLTIYPVAGDGPSLFVINAHLLNFKGLAAFKSQLADIEVMLTGHKGAIILAADFNTWNPGRMRFLKSFADNLGLTQAPLVNDNRILKLDHVFSRGVQIDQARVLTRNELSDHRPIEFSFQIESSFQDNHF